ncbi:MAG: M10 family metallopeptidase C-terminal domain-containing protein [Vitreimonas sp.]
MLSAHRWPWDHHGVLDSGPSFDDFNQPQYTILPSSGTASNGKPIFSWDDAAAQITRGWPSVGWNNSLGTSLTISYAFRSTAPLQMPDDTSGFSRFSGAQIVAAEFALQEWASVANITFIRTGAGTSGNGAYSNNATILFANYSAGAAGAAAFAYFAAPGQTGASSIAGDVWVNSSLAENQSLNNLDYGAQVLLHEIGHALGLEHPGDYNAGPNVSPTYDADAVYWQDTRMFTVMSYFGSVNTGGSLPGLASGPQLHDIAAIQRLYGANTHTRTGDTVYGFNSNTGDAHFSIASGSVGAVFSIWDTGGNDTLDLSGYSTNSNIDLRPESFTSAGPGDSTSTISTDALYNISIARGVIIENAIGGSGDDTITGNDVANVLMGNGGNDTLIGGAGADTLNGGAGADKMDGGDGNDTIFWDASDDLANVLGGNGADVLVFTSGAAPTSFNLAAHGFETAEGRFTDPGANAWATQTDYYDSAWRLDLTAVSNDDGSRSTLDFDQTNASSWASAYLTYDAQNRLDADVTYFDDGTHAVNDYDQASAFNWSTTWASYDAQGRLDTDVVTYDDGSHAVRDLDQNNSFNWAVTWASYDTQGRLDTDVVTYDDGSHAVRDLDQANAFNWAQQWWFYDSQGHLVSHVTTYDDGTFGP